MGLLLHARSLRDKLDSLVELKLLFENLDILSITESWLRPNEYKFREIPGYKAHFCARNSNSYFVGSEYCKRVEWGGGVCVYVRDYWDSNVIKAIEQRYNVFHVQNEKQSDKINCILCYSPNLNTYSELINNLEQIISGLKGQKTIVLGDFNVNLLANDSFAPEHGLFFTNYGLEPKLLGHSTRTSKLHRHF